MSDENGPNVTYVGGRAIEQTETLESDRPADELDAAKKAVREAIKASAEKAGKEAAEDAKSDRAKDPYKPPGTKKESKETKPETDDGAERGPDGRFLPRKGVQERSSDSKDESSKDDSEEPLDPATAPLKQLLKNREKLANQKRELKEDAAKERESLRQEAAKQEAARQEFQRQQYEFQQKQYEFQRQQKALEALRNDPARAVKEFGWEPEKFILDLAQEGTPEGQARRQQLELQRRMEAFESWQRQQVQAAQKAQEEAYMRQAMDARNNAVNSFLKLGMDDEKYPHVANFYRGNEKFLIAAGDLTAEEYRNLSGKEGSFEQILDYLEDELAERSKKLYTKSIPDKKVESERVVREPPKGKGKSLSPDMSSERRSLTQSELKNLDDDERREAAKQAVKVATANSSKD